MNDSPVTIAIYWNPVEAQLAKLRAIRGRISTHQGLVLRQTSLEKTLSGSRQVTSLFPRRDAPTRMSDAACV